MDRTTARVDPILLDTTLYAEIVIFVYDKRRAEKREREREREGKQIKNCYFSYIFG